MILRRVKDAARMLLFIAVSLAVTAFLFNRSPSSWAPSLRLQDIFYRPYASEADKLHPPVISTPISWAPCSRGTKPDLECGRLEVPLDYANPAAGSASLLMRRMKSKVQPPKGTLFSNPGGPGVVSEFLQWQVVMDYTGGEYDIVSWDLRGLSHSIPNVKCFESQADMDEFWQGSLWYSGIETDSALRSGVDYAAFYSHVDAEDAKLRGLWRRCSDHSGDLLKYMGTAATARDVAAMADALDGEGAEINFWGFSSGSALGQYIVALFPRRAGKIILDGLVYGPHWSVMRPVEFYNTLLTHHTVENFHGLARLCAEAGPDRCALARSGSTGPEIIVAVQRLVKSLYDPGYKLPPYLARSSAIRMEIFLSLFSPRKWQGLSGYLQSQVELLDAWEPSGGGAPTTAAAADAPAAHELKDFWDYEFYPIYWSIVCADAADSNGTSTREVFDTIMDVTTHQSVFFGPMWPSEGAWPCHQWDTRAVERVTDFRATPKHPVLLLANEHDPITSIENAYDVVEHNYPRGSVGLGVRAGYGHCSYSMKSPCIVDVVKAYMHDWTLPADGMTPCPVDDDLYPSENHSTHSTVLAARPT